MTQSNEETNVKTDKDVVSNSNRCYEENKVISQQVTAGWEVDLWRDAWDMNGIRHQPYKGGVFQTEITAGFER